MFLIQAIFSFYIWIYVAIVDVKTICLNSYRIIDNKVFAPIARDISVQLSSPEIPTPSFDSKKVNAQNDSGDERQNSKINNENLIFSKPNKNYISETNSSLEKNNTLDKNNTLEKNNTLNKNNSLNKNNALDKNYTSDKNIKFGIKFLNSKSEHKEDAKMIKNADKNKTTDNNINETNILQNDDNENEIFTNKKVIDHTCNNFHNNQVSEKLVDFIMDLPQKDDLFLSFFLKRKYREYDCQGRKCKSFDPPNVTFNLTFKKPENTSSIQVNWYPYSNLNNGLSHISFVGFYGKEKVLNFPKKDYVPCTKVCFPPTQMNRLEVTLYSSNSSIEFESFSICSV